MSHSDQGPERDDGRRRAVQPVERPRDTRVEASVGEPQGYGPYGDPYGQPQRMRAALPAPETVDVRQFKVVGEKEEWVDEWFRLLEKHGLEPTNYGSWIDTRLHSSGDDARDMTVEEDHNLGKVSLIGAGMRSHPGVAAKMFRTLADLGINLRMIATSPIKVSCMIKKDEIPKAVQALHAAFELEQEPVEEEAVRG